MITEDGTHWLETSENEDVTVGILGEPGNWIVTLRRGNVCLASAANSSLIVAFNDALETSANLVRYLRR